MFFILLLLIIDTYNNRLQGGVPIRPTNKAFASARIYAIGDAAAAVQFGSEISPLLQQKVRAFARVIEEEPFTGCLEYTPAFTGVTVFYDPFLVYQAYGEENESPFDIVTKLLKDRLKRMESRESPAARRVTIPVCYGGDYGPDLAFVARYNNLSEREVIHLHSSGTYPVYMIGFAPGFPYLGGLPARLNTPRRSSPRAAVPAGSVGIAGSQTGVYPISTPGGWQLIGRTPVRLFQPARKEPSFLSAGDIVVFKPIADDEFDEYREKEI